MQNILLFVVYRDNCLLSGNLSADRDFRDLIFCVITGFHVIQQKNMLCGKIGHATFVCGDK